MKDHLRLGMRETADRRPAGKHHDEKDDDTLKGKDAGQTPRNYALQTNIALEAHALSGGKPNYAYQRAQILRRHARREALVLKPVNAHRLAQREEKRVWFEFTPEAEKALEEALELSWPAVLRAADDEARVNALWRDHFGDPETWQDDDHQDDETKTAFERSWLEDSTRRRNAYLKRTLPIRQAEEFALWGMDGAAEAVERWAGCVCFGTGYVTVSDGYIVGGARESESGDAPNMRRVRCEVCQERERRQRLEIEADRFHAELLAWLLEWFAEKAGMTSAQLVKSRGSHREVWDTLFAVFVQSTGLTQADGAKVARWSEATASRVVNAAIELWPELGRQDSPALPSPAGGYDGGAHLSEVGLDSSPGPASPLSEKTMDGVLRRPSTSDKEIELDSRRTCTPPRRDHGVNVARPSHHS